MHALWTAWQLLTGCRRCRSSCCSNMCRDCSLNYKLSDRTRHQHRHVSDGGCHHCGRVIISAVPRHAMERNYLSMFPGTLTLPRACTAPQNMPRHNHQSWPMPTDLPTDLCRMLTHFRNPQIHQLIAMNSDHEHEFLHWLAIQNTWPSDAMVQNCYISTLSVKPRCICLERRLRRASWTFSNSITSLEWEMSQ